MRKNRARRDASREENQISLRVVVFFCSLLTVLLLTCFADAEKPTKVAHIGFLTAISASSMSARMDAFRKGLHDLGYVEGKNILIDYRYADGKPDNLSEFATEARTG